MGYNGGMREAKVMRSESFKVIRALFSGGKHQPKVGIMFKYTLDYSKPVAVEDFSSSLEAISDSFRVYAEKEGIDLKGDQYKLYVEEIKQGSIVVDIIAVAGHVVTGIDASVQIAGYARYLKDAYDFLNGNREADAKEYTKREYKNFHDIVNPVVNDTKSELKIENSGNINIGSVTLIQNFNSGNTAQNRTDHYIGMSNIPANGLHTDMLLRLYQTRNDPKGKTGDRGIIDKLSSKHVKLAFASDDIKSQILEDPYGKIYQVDVDVQSIDDQPRLYKVVELKDMEDK